MGEYPELTISLERRGSKRFAVEWSWSLPDSDTDPGGPSEEHRIETDDLPEILVEEADVLAYGRSLSKQIFGIPMLKKALDQARAAADTQPFRFRLSLPANDDLQDLRWEAMSDPDAPEPGAPLFVSERILFSRFVESPDWRSAPRRAKSSLSALVVVSNPKDLKGWSLYGQPPAPIDVKREVKRACKGLVGIDVKTLGDRDRATLNRLVERLDDGPDILYLVCHGALVEGEPQLWLEDDEGHVAVTAGSELVTRLRNLLQPPRLVVLISCQSAGTGRGDALGALGPRLGEAGVPAVLAMHGNVTMKTVDAFMPVFFQELQDDGQIDRAVAKARSTVQDRPDAWAPVLYMRLKSGTLWYEPNFGAEEGGRPYEGWRALINHINKGTCTPILGPGLTDSLIGPRREIARRWAETSEFPMAPHDQEDLPQVAQYEFVNQEDSDIVLEEFRSSVRTGLLSKLGKTQSRARLEAPVDDLLVELGTRRWRSNPCEPHWVLAQAPFRIYITATLNSLLFEALKAVGKKPREELFRWNDDADWPPSVYDEDPDYSPTLEEPLIFHLFGRLGVRDSVVMTEDDYFDYLIGATRNSDLIPDEIRYELSNNSLLFVGFEMDGWDFRVLYRSLMFYLQNPTPQKKKGKIAHAGVQIDLEEGRILNVHRARDYIESYFEDTNVHIYWGSVDDFARELRRQQTGGSA